MPHRDRAGCLWLGRGRLAVRDGTLHFVTAGYEELPPGDYDIAYQTVSAIIMEPGATVTHDAVRLLARHGTGLVYTGVDGVRFYSSMPRAPDSSARARRQVAKWADPESRLLMARRMYAFRLGELLVGDRIEQLRGMEGARARRSYTLLAERFGVPWNGRRYDRENPEAADAPNKAINHASSAVVACAEVAVAVSGAIPQLGFIHEDSGIAFALDIADLYRDEITVTCAFEAWNTWKKRGGELERWVRKHVGRTARTKQLVASMIDRVKELLDDDDRSRDP